MRRSVSCSSAVPLQRFGVWGIVPSSGEAGDGHRLNTPQLKGIYIRELQWQERLVLGFLFKAPLETQRTRYRYEWVNYL